VNRSLLSIAQLSTPELQALLSDSIKLQDSDARSTTLAGKTIGLLFYENSTRTRISFENAIRRTGATPLSLAIASSSVQKGETLQDSARNLAALGVDGFIIRHPDAGAADLLARSQPLPVINAGDGMHAHPTQALLDATTMWQAWGCPRNWLAGKRILILGDIRHSRVARSNLELLPRLGAEVTLCGPGPLLPQADELTTYGSIGRLAFPNFEVLREIDAVMVLRLQRERQTSGFIPSLAEYTHYWGLNREQLAMLRKDALILHPGPANPDVEICVEAMEDPRSRIIDQVKAGIFVRMAVLLRAFGRLE
jgi:aspartate carbamoyltransferase catalytic subunit